ncbi:MAG: flippase, partial [Cytophagales bacterium]|nr:flippase [Cytophagales bacterium]
MSFDKIIKMLLGIVVGLNVAKYLGPKDYGEMSYGMLYFSFFLPLATLGIDSFVVRDLSQRPEDRTKLMGSIFSLRIMGALVAVILSMVTAFFLQSGQSQILTIIGINVALFFMQSFESCDLVFQSQLKSKYPSYVRTFNYVIFSGIKLWFIYQKSDLMSFVWVYAIELFFNSVFLVFIYQWKIGDLWLWRPDLSYMQSWIRESPILILQGFAVLAQARMDQFMLEKILDIKAFGEYSLASRLIEMTYFLPTAIYTSAAPRIAEAKLKSEELYQEKLKNLYKLMILLFLAMALPIVTLGKFTIDTFFEGKFEQAGLIFVLLGSRMIYINISTAKTLYYVNENQTM